MSQDPAYRTQQLTDFVRINVELVRGQLACAGVGRNVQVTELAVNQIVDVGRTAETREGHENRLCLIILVHGVNLQADAGPQLEHSN